MKKVVSFAAAVFLAIAALPLSAFAAETAAPADSGKIAVSSDQIQLKEEDTRSLGFTVQAAGKYQLVVTYQCVKGKTTSPLLGVAFDKQDAKADDVRFTLPRLWQAEKAKNGRFEKDGDGNELPPAQTEQFADQTMVIPISADNTVELSQGDHTLNLYMVLESVVLKKIVLQKPPVLQTYQQYLAQYPGKGDATKSFTQEAEEVTAKSDLSIVTSFDRSLPSISPSSPDKILYNILGGSSWSKEGQWVTWDLDVKQDGFYQLDLAYRQNALDGITVRRRILLDNTVPFADMDCVEFPYAKDFTNFTLADAKGTPYKFYLSAGHHTLKMEVVLGKSKEILSQFRACIFEMNALYNKINIIVGNQTDTYRDYDLDESIPNLVSTLRKQADEISDVAKFLNGNNKSGGSQTARMEETVRLLRTFADKPSKIPDQLEYFRTQINTMSDVLASMMSQPMELDTFTLRAPQQKAHKISNNFFKYVGFRFEAFFSSFSSDYAQSAPDSGKSLKVWVSSNDLLVSGFSSGRDQAQIIDQLCTNDFSVKTGIKANLSLINASDTLMQAVASGRGPDVVMLTPKNIIANLYYRGALVDLHQMPGCDEIVKNYYPSSMISLQTDGKLYALPEVQMFNMLFYRKDIFAQNGLTPPKTWDEFYKTVFRLQNAGLQIGITENQMIYEMFLLQNGSTLYNSTLSTTRLKEKSSVDAFSSWTSLYSKYGFPLSFDMLNRFRTGQMPMTIAPYYFYSQVAVSAPEIDNLWTIAPVPGTVGKDGTINNSESSSISGTIVLKNKKDDYDAAFQFLKWWAGTDVQTQYAFECESRVGISARYSPANIEAMSSIAWTKDEYKALNEQWKSVSDIPQTPASYFVTRNLSNAYRRVVYDYENPRDVIYRYGQEIDNELTRKREELGIGN